MFVFQSIMLCKKACLHSIREGIPFHECYADRLDLTNRLRTMPCQPHGKLYFYLFLIAAAHWYDVTIYHL